MACHVAASDTQLTTTPPYAATSSLRELKWHQRVNIVQMQLVQAETPCPRMTPHSCA